MFKSFDFECKNCGNEFDALVKNESHPDYCPHCGDNKGFVKLISAPKLLTSIIPSYPGSKKQKAGYVHTHGDRPAEKKGSQISMYGTRKKHDGKV